ncbi:hypothetical protein ACFQMA_21925 [Halosimplex aquaticum]|uniref:Tat (Twin-arginine translocation) pathway signal sequence n=1 Tax=Halosimplex aquaticum TaxID=3026162 RepID=A0ABD5Y9E1_9EURY|nr:hypothetical protein [Halosimplex aquaticum]
MQRRRVLRGLAAVAAGAAAGCTGANREVPVTAPEPPDEVRNAGSGGSSNGGETPESLQFAVPEWSYEATEDGDLRVVLTVENRAQSPDEATMTVVLTAGDKRFTPTEHVSLQPGESREIRIVVPVAYSEYDAEPGFEVRFDPGAPETPLPEGTVTPYPEDRETATASSTGTANSTAVATTASDGDPTATE